MEFHKYKKIKPLGDPDNEDIFLDPQDEIFIQEKLDGANFRFIIQRGILIFGSRGQQLTSDEGEDTNVGKSFVMCLEHIRDTLKGKDLTEYEGLIFYGECMVKHTIHYEWEKIPAFLGFDIMLEDKFLHTTLVKKTFADLGLDMVPEIKRTFAGDIKEVTDADVPISKYAPLSNINQQAEGIVFKNHTKQLYAKYVRLAFKEDNKLTFGEIGKFAEGFDAQLIAKYCTNARIEKAIWKFVDMGKQLDMALTPMISGFVYQDIWEEEWKSIIKLNKELDMRKFRKGVLLRCKAVLDQMITNNAILKKKE